MIKQSVQFPNNQYQHIQSQLNTTRKILSFSRSLGQLKWNQDKLQVNRQKISKAVNQIVNNRQQLPNNCKKQNDQFKMTKKLSKLYDQYPVHTKKDPSEQFEYLPFIPSELLLRPLKIDPKFTHMLLPKNKYPNMKTDSYQKRISDRIVTDQKTLDVKLYQKQDLKYFNSDESSLLPFTTLKDYLDVQNIMGINNAILQDNHDDII